MALSAQEVERLAKLARIDLTPEELERLAPQLDLIISSVATVSEVAGEDVGVTTHAVELSNVFRDDVVGSSLSSEAALSGAPVAEDGRFRVPRILGEES
ncbi:MAG: Asp-tRNA(Asn)/Glu-tRNA(Gln) amidotransferase subunit GatC [Propionibacteriaceae bacterium]|nr:Asp-tRNA(Asn)/Glu-tRNA(Gln) amidotransferase subunit GatC [Propionibacteriaceae bacterium]